MNGQEKVGLTGPLLGQADGDGPPFNVRIVGNSAQSDIEENTLRWLCDDTERSDRAAEAKNRVCIIAPSPAVGRCAWIIYLAANVTDMEVTLDATGVEHVEFADGAHEAWPLIIKQGGYAIDFAYTDDGKTLRINKIVGVSRVDGIMAKKQR